MSASSNPGTDGPSAVPSEASDVSVQQRIERNPYLALAGALSVGWVLGRRLRLPLVGAFAGIAVRVAAAAIIERVVADLATRNRRS